MAPWWFNMQTTYDVLASLSRELSVYGFVATSLLIVFRYFSILSLISGFLTIAAGFAILTIILGWLISQVLPNPKVDPKGKAVLITGCDRGFGHLLACRLDNAGYKVFACCLFPEGEGAATLKKSSSDRLHIIEMDVTKESHVKEAVKTVRNNLDGTQLWAVVANAGVNLFMEFEWMPMQDFQWMFDINVFGVIRVVQAFTPMIRQSQGRIILVASYAGRLAPMWIVPYAMTKAAIISLADGLRREMKKWNVTVSTIEPTYYLTDINPKTEEEMLKKWDKMPEHIKSAYGTNYVRESLNFILTFLKNVSRTNITEVIDSMELSVSQTYPKKYYRCDGFLTWIGALLAFNMPSVVSDSVVSYMGLPYSPNPKSGTLEKKGFDSFFKVSQESSN